MFQNLLLFQGILLELGYILYCSFKYRFILSSIKAVISETLTVFGILGHKTVQIVLSFPFSQTILIQQGILTNNFCL